MELRQDWFAVGFGTNGIEPPCSATTVLIMCMCEFEIFSYTPNYVMFMILHENTHHDMGQEGYMYYTHVNQLGMTFY
jgi:hypothetical protein